ncbi:MAG: basic amino acid ABC transporter substrate-binding protein [candidate division Zixibacteria bacterium HGW-Zixibacteria-1]|nr:MAG: basic amino acid ABC transporter substrate-binding protein [candidate division Zixibacteria bacterium HGW-Zixibacteria-1]
MTRKFIITIFIALFVFGCAGEKDIPVWKEKSVLLVGTDATYPPFELVNTDSGLPEGFDMDIIGAICRVNGWTPEFIITPFDGIIPGLKNHKYDCIISAMTITPQREASVSFSKSYYLAGQIVAVSLGDSVIKSVDDLRGRKVGVQLGTTGERMAKSLEGLTVFSFDNIGAAFIDMENGHIDAVLNDYPTTMAYIKSQGRAKTVGELLSTEHYGIAVRKDDAELLGKIDSALELIQEKGEYDRLESKWFGHSNDSD